MMDVFVSFTMNLLEYWILILLMQYICSAHMSLNRKTVLLCSGISLLTTLVSLCLAAHLPYISLFSMPVSILLAVLLCSFRWTDFFLYIPAFALYFILAFIPERILVILLPSLNAAFVLPDSNLTFTTLLSDLILFSFLLLLRRVLTKYRTAMRFRFKEALGSVGLVFFSMIDVMFLLSLDRSRMSAPMYYIWVFIFVGLMLFCLGYYLYSLLEARVLLYRRMTAENETIFLKLQLEALQDMKENEEQVQKMRHDLSNHLSVIQSLCAEGSYGEAAQYTKQLQTDIALPGSKVLSGNKTADFVLRSKMKLAEELHIPFTFEGSLERLGHLRKPDLCSLLSNAYDNAIEACKDLSAPYIRTVAHSTGNYTVIRITNPVARKINIRHGRVATAKEDKKSHGYGTRIMNDIAQRYDGSCIFSCTDREFSVKITLLSSDIRK